MGREKGKNKDGINILSPELVSALLRTEEATSMFCLLTSDSSIRSLTTFASMVRHVKYS